MTRTTDNELLEALAPLRCAAPAEGAALRAVRAVEALEAPPRRLTVPRVALVITAATALGIGVLAALPTAQTGPHGVPALAAAAAAAAAAVPDTANGFRYVKALERLTYGRGGDSSGTLAFTVPSETWVDRSWRGTIRTGQSIDVVRGGRPGAPGPDTQVQRLGDSPFAYGDGSLRGLDAETLPTDGPAVDALLDRRFADDELPQKARAYPAVRSKLTMLTLAKTTPAQRSALWESLAATPGLIDEGEGKDPEGRPGHVVRIPAGTPGASTITVVFDPGTSEVLSWSAEVQDASHRPQAPYAGYRFLTAEQHIFLGAGHVTAEGERP